MDPTTPTPDPKPPPAPAPPAHGIWPTRRGIAHITMAAAIGAGVVGFLVGIRAGVPTETGRSPNNGQVVAATTDIPEAVEYAQLADAGLGPNAGWRSVLPASGASIDDLFGTLPANPQQRARALADRAQLRAFDGAPPVVPHHIDQLNPTACMACHGEGLSVGDVRAPRMSHDFLTNCTQCHVASAGPSLAGAPPTFGDNAFVGRSAAGPGDRAWEGAPPTIPHTTWMRRDCASCHGTLNDDGLRTSHPWRTNCTQCHAPSAELDQHAFLTPFTNEGQP